MAGVGDVGGENARQAATDDMTNTADNFSNAWLEIEDLHFKWIRPVNAGVSFKL